MTEEFHCCNVDEVTFINESNDTNPALVNRVTKEQRVPMTLMTVEMAVINQRRST